MKKTDFTKALTAYFSTYLPLTCGVSPNTCNSYRDAFKLLLLYFQEEKGVPANSIELRMLNRNLVSDFLIGWKRKGKCLLQPETKDWQQ